MNNPQNFSLGQDSFLDIVANLVGILIILIVVVGAQAATVWNQPQPNKQLESKAVHIAQETDTRLAEANNMKLENRELHDKIRYEQALALQLADNRRRLLHEIEYAKLAVQNKKEMLQQEQLIRHDLFAKLNSLKQEIRQVQYEFAAVSNQSKATVQTIEHYPTPIARTVFSDEIHFQILGGRIVHVPMSDLVDLMKAEWRDKARNLIRAGHAQETVGPVENFFLHYFLSAHRNESHAASEFAVRFDGFQLQAVTPNGGETIPAALDEEDSLFKQYLSRMVPEKTTVSIWVYPDGYDDLINVRKWLRSKGFQTASWPLDFGKPISGGPNGFRTTTN